jgi:hypothetical protein
MRLFAFCILGFLWLGNASAADDAATAVTEPPAKEATVPVDINLIASYLDQADTSGLHYTRARPTEIDFAIQGEKGYFPACITVNPDAKTIYMATFAGKLPPGNEHTADILAQLMEENYVSNWTKIEWDKNKGDVRISYTFLYDDGFPYQEFAFIREQLRLSSISVQAILNKTQPGIDEPQPANQEEPPAVTQAEIAGILDQRGITYTIKNESTLEFDAKGDNATFLVQIRLDPKLDFLYLAIPYIVTVPPDSPQAEIIMPALMDLNFRCGLAKFEWFRKAGEVRSSFVFHVKHIFSSSAFITALLELIKTTDLAYPTLSRLENAQS